jgi:hypothetical protein
VVESRNPFIDVCNSEDRSSPSSLFLGLCRLLDLEDLREDDFRLRLSSELARDLEETSMDSPDGLFLRRSSEVARDLDGASLVSSVAEV